MNKTMKKLNITIIIGILAVWVSGSLFHFVYDWTGKNTFVGLFFPTNESTWEHMKLAFLPMNLYGIYTWYALKDRFAASGFAILLGANVATWAIPFLYYTYFHLLNKLFIDWHSRHDIYCEHVPFLSVYYLNWLQACVITVL